MQPNPFVFPTKDFVDLNKCFNGNERNVALFFLSVELMKFLLIQP